jgi:hypothetical protein
MIYYAYTSIGFKSYSFGSGSYVFSVRSQSLFVIMHQYQIYYIYIYNIYIFINDRKIIGMKTRGDMLIREGIYMYIYI